MLWHRGLCLVVVVVVVVVVVIIIIISMGFQHYKQLPRVGIQSVPLCTAQHPFRFISRFSFRSVLFLAFSENACLLGLWTWFLALLYSSCSRWPACCHVRLSACIKSDFYGTGQVVWRRLMPVVVNVCFCFALLYRRVGYRMQLLWVAIFSFIIRSYFFCDVRHFAPNPLYPVHSREKATVRFNRHVSNEEFNRLPWFFPLHCPSKQPSMFLERVACGLSAGLLLRYYGQE